MQEMSKLHHMFALKVPGQECFIVFSHWICYLAVILSWTCVVCPWHVAWRQTASVRGPCQIVPEGCVIIVVEYRVHVSAPVA